MLRSDAIPGDTAVKARRKASKSPTARSLAMLRLAGYTVAIVEHYNAFIKVRMDLWGIFDLLCMHPVERIVAVQVTTMSNKSKRLDKMQASPRLNQWKAAGGRAQLHAWRKLKSVTWKNESATTGEVQKFRRGARWECEVTEL